MRHWIFPFSDLLPKHVDKVLQDVFGRFHRIVLFCIAILSHYLFPFSAIVDMSDDVIESMVFGMTSITFFELRLVVHFSRVFEGRF